MAKVKKVLPREHIDHSKHPLPTTERQLYTWTLPDGQYWNQIDNILCSQRWRSSVQSAKTRPEADCGSDHELLIAKFRLKLKKVGKTTGPLKWKWKSLSHVQLFVTPCTVHGILPARILESVAFPVPGDLTNPGIEPRSPVSQADSLPAEPQGKPKNTGVGSLHTPSLADLLNPRIEPGSPALQVNSLPTELSGKPLRYDVNKILYS